MLRAIELIYDIKDGDLLNVGEDAINSPYTKMDRRRAIAAYKKNKSLGEAEREVGISRNTIREWVKRFLGAGV